jgi:hypothetical protein
MGDPEKFTARISGCRVIDRGDDDGSSVGREREVAVVCSRQGNVSNEIALWGQDGDSTASVQRYKHVAVAVSAQAVRSEVLLLRAAM